MTDLASLGVVVDTRQLKDGAVSLDQLAEKGGKAEAATKSLTSATEVLANVVKTVAASYAVLKVLEYAREAALLQARYETLGIVMSVVGKNAGYTAQEMESAAVGMQKMGISMVESRQQATKLVQAHIDLSYASKLARIAQDAAVIGNMNSSDAFASMIHGIQTGQTEVLRTIGLNISMENSYKLMAQTLGKNKDMLTQNEKTQAILNAVMKAGADIAGSYAASMDTASKQLLSMKRYTEDLKVMQGEVFNEMLTVAVMGYTAHLKDANGEVSELARNGQLKEWGESLTDVFVAVLDNINNIIGAVKILATMAGHLSAQSEIRSNYDPQIAALSNKGFDTNVAELKKLEAAKSAALVAEASEYEAAKKAILGTEDRFSKALVERRAATAQKQKNVQADLSNWMLQEAIAVENQATKIRKAAEDKATVTGKGHGDKAAEAEAKLYASTLQKLQHEIGGVVHQTELQKIQYEVTAGSLKALTEAHKNKVLAEAAEVDAIKAAMEIANARATLRKKEDEGIAEYLLKQQEGYNAAVKGSKDALAAAQAEYDQFGMSRSQIAAITLARLEDQLAATSGTGPLVAALQIQIDKQKELIGVFQKIEIRNDMIDAARVAAHAWKDAGEDIAESLEKAFGEGGKAAGGMVKAMTSGMAKQIKIDDEYAKNKTGNMVKDAELAKTYQNDTTRNSLDSFGEMAGAAKGFFDEKSKGYQAMAAIEKTMHIISLAMNAKTMISNFATAATGVMSGAGQMFGQSGWGGFAGVAAMMAVMAGLGFAGGGGGGGAFINMPKNEGKGSVLGDDNAQSKSIDGSINTLAANSNIALKVSNSMLSALNTIRDNIGALAAMVSMTTGIRGTAADRSGVESSSSFIGLFGSETKLTGQGLLFGQQKKTSTKADDVEVDGTTIRGLVTITTSYVAQTVDQLRAAGVAVQKFTDITTDSTGLLGSLFGSGERQSTKISEADQRMKDQITAIILGSVDAVIGGAVALGGNKQDLTKQLGGASVDLGKIDFSGMTGEEVQDTLKAVFGAFADGLAEQAVPAIKEFERAGEGGLATLSRLVSGIDQAGLALGQLGIKAIDYTEIINKQGNVFTEIARQSITNAEKTGTFSNVHTDEFSTTTDVVTQKWIESTEQFVFNAETLNSELTGVAGHFIDVTTAVTTLTPATDVMVADLTGIGQIVQAWTGSPEDLIAAYSTMVSIRAAMTSFGMSAADVTAEMIRGAGSLDNLSAGVAAYFDKFFTADEKLASQHSLLADSFSALGITMPTTNAEFRTFAEGIDRSTAAGQLLYGQVMALAGGFANWTDGVDSAAKTLQDSLDATAQAAIDAANRMQQAIAAFQSSATGGVTADNLLGNLNTAMMGVTGGSPWITSIEQLMSQTQDDFTHYTEKQQAAIIAARQAYQAWQSKLKAGETQQQPGSYSAAPAITPEVIAALPTHQLEIQLLQLQGKALEALNLQRQDETQNLSASDKALKLQIYALQDAAKTRNLEIQIMELTGDTAGALAAKRAIEMMGMVDSDKALQIRIYQLQDEAAAAAAAAEAAAKLAELAKQSASIDIEIMQLSGNAAGALAAQRAIELAAMDESLRAKQQEVYTLQDQAQAAKAATDAMSVLVEQMDAVAALKSSLGSDIRSIKSTLPGYDNGAYLTAQVKSARVDFMASLTGGSIDDQIKSTGNLQSAIMARYQGEIDAANKAHEAQAAADKAAIDAANQLNAAHRKLGDYAKSLLVGAGTVLSPDQQLAEAKRQYESTLSMARGGDLTAAGNLQGASQTYLDLARGYFASNQDYVKIFGDVQGAMAAIGAQAGPDQVYHENTVAWQADLSRIQERALRQLTELSKYTDGFQAKLQAKLDEQTLIFTSMGLNTAQIAANTEGLDLRIGAAIGLALSAQESLYLNPMIEIPVKLPPIELPPAESLFTQFTNPNETNRVLVEEIKTLRADLVEAVNNQSRTAAKLAEATAIENDKSVKAQTVSIDRLPAATASAVTAQARR